MINHPPLESRRRPELSGAALVVTLAILVLLLGLTMSLFLSATSERRSASLYKNAQGVRELADTAVNLVQAQIKDATTENAAAAPGSRSAWASQPGMIRTYGSATTAARSYKLYSWTDPRPAGDAADAVPTTWAGNPALYTDLNQPVPNSESPANTNAYRYPIAYPPVAYTLPPGDSYSYTIASDAPLAASGNFTNPVPMPVQWLYVLQNGAVAYPTSATGSTVTVAGADPTNPIVGRIAYWTDDETCKVNLNTAAGGEYWAKPVQKTETQFLNSLWQPTRWEFQRYAGHPARTDVRKVFPGLTRQEIWAMIPRVSDNGSDKIKAQTTAPTDVPYDMDRLFTSIGEVRFSSNSSTGGNRPDFNSGNYTAADWQTRIEQVKFLATTASRAPETTIYGTPRVAVWPLSSTDTTTKRTTLDSLIAFCSTIRNSGSLNNPQPYYFGFIRKKCA